MASFSDAHECDEIPIIAANMHRMILPRQSQIWAVVKAGQPLQKLYYQICSGLFGAALLLRRAGRPLGSAVDHYGRRHGILRQGGLHHRPRRQPAVGFPHRQLPCAQGLASGRAAR